MISRSSLVAACLVLLVAASLPAGAYSTASTSLSTASTQQEDGDAEILDSLGCLPSPALRDISMNAYSQESTNLQTQGGSVASTSTGPKDEQETFEIESGLISASTICFSASDDERESVELQLNDVEFEDTSLIGPWTDVEFERGEANSMTVVLPPEEVLSLLVQIPGSIDLIETIKDLFGIGGYEVDETGSETNDTDDGSSDEIGDTGENPTDAVDDTVTNSTDAVNDTVDNTTDTVNDTVDSTTGTIDETVDNTTDTVDDTVTDTPIDETVDNTTDAVDETVDTTTDTVDDTVETTTGILGGFIGNTTGILTAPVDSAIG